MDARITAVCLIILIGTPLLMLMHMDAKHSTTKVSDAVSEDEQHINPYMNYIVVDQEELQLNHEVVQYQIIFHENDTINVSAFMALQHLGRDLEPQASLLIVSNGTASIFETSNVSFLMYIPSAIIFDMTILRHRFAFGGRIFFTLLHRTRYRIGVSLSLHEEVDVKKGEVWFLTLADFNSKPGETLTIAFRSLSSSPSMELGQTERHTNIGFYSALDNDFEGRYMGFKLPFLPFGFSFADEVHKEVATSKGSIVYFCSIGHVKGRLKVQAPNNSVYLNTNTKIAVFCYCGNWTGRWNFSASGLGFPWKHLVTLFYVDADPHITMYP